MLLSGTITSNFIFNETEKKLAVQVRQVLARSTLPMKERVDSSLITINDKNVTIKIHPSTGTDTCHRSPS